MPRIVQYENQVNVDPSILNMAARRVDVLGEQRATAIEGGLRGVRQGLDAVEQHVAASETSKLAADMSMAQAELTTQWDETIRKADPNDKDVASRFQSEVVAPRLEGIGSGLLTQSAQDMYTRASAGLKADLFKKTIADQATLAGNAAIVNLNTVVNNLSQTVRNDPTSLNSAMTMAHLTTEGLVQSYGLPRDKALELGIHVRGEIAKSAFLGMADKNPAAAIAELDKGTFKDYFDGTTANEMQNYAEHQQKAAAADARAQEIEDRRQQKEGYDGAMAQLQAATINPQTGLPQIPAGYNKALLQIAEKFPTVAEAGTIRAMQEWQHTVIEDQAKGTPVISDAEVYENFAQRMMLPKGDPNALTARDVYAARTQHMLSDKDTGFFLEGQKHLEEDPARKEAERQFNFFLETQKSAFTSTNQFTGFRDPKGDQKYYNFAITARQQFEAAYAKGPEAWKQTLTPGNPNFVGNMASHFITSQKGGKLDTDLYGTTQGGFRFTGHTAAEWNDKAKWQKVGQ